MNLELRNRTGALSVEHETTAPRSAPPTGTSGLTSALVPTVGSTSSAPVQARDLRMETLAENRKNAILGAAARQTAVQMACMGAGIAATRAAVAVNLPPIVAQGASQLAVLLVKEAFPLKAGHEMKASRNERLLGMRADIAANLFDGVVAAGALAGATHLASHLIGLEMGALRGGDAATALRAVLSNWRILAQTQGIVRTADLIHDVAAAAAHAFSPGAEHKYNDPAAWSSWVSLSSKEGVVGFLGGTLARGITAAVSMGGAAAVVSQGISGEGVAYSLQSMKQNAAGIIARAPEANSKQALKDLFERLILGGSRPREADEEIGLDERPQAIDEELRDAAALPLPPSSRASSDAVQNEAPAVEDETQSTTTISSSASSRTSTEAAEHGTETAENETRSTAAIPLSASSRTSTDTTENETETAEDETRSAAAIPLPASSRTSIDTAENETETSGDETPITAAVSLQPSSRTSTDTAENETETAEDEARIAAAVPLPASPRASLETEREPATQRPRSPVDKPE